MPRERDNKRAVAPIVSTILLVAIVIILCTVTITFGLTFIDTVKTGSPDAAFETKQSNDGIHIVHQTGNSIDVENLYIVYANTNKKASRIVSINELSAGESIGPIDPNGGSEINLIWEDEGESYIIYTADDYEKLNFGNSGGSDPSVSSFSGSNPSDQDVKISFDSTEALSAITVEVTGAEAATLSKSDFTKSENTYTATYAGSSDGDYTATLTKAEDANGNDGANGQSDTVTVNTPILNKAKTIVYQGLGAVGGDGGETSSIGASGVKALGPPETDLTGDGSNDLPYVKGGNLKIIDSAGNAKTLVSDEAPSNPNTDKTLLAVGTWQKSSKSIFYVNENRNEIWRVDSSGSTSKVAAPGNGANAVMGTGDIDGDGTEELLFADGSQQVRYLEPGGTTKKVNGGGTGSNNGIGVGKPLDFDGDGTVRVVVVDGSNNVKIVGSAEPDLTFTSTSAKKAPVASADVDDDGSLEIIYVGSSGYLKYVDSPLDSPTIQTLTDNKGNKTGSDGKLGVVS